MHICGIMTVVKFLPNTLEHKESKMKQVIFNVGGALSSYIEAYGKKILLDIGSSMDFNPIIDFLFPLFNRRYGKSMEKRNIDQLIISHPHYDHLSAIKEFDAHFTATLITCPNDNQPQDKKYKINWELVDNQTDECIKYLKEKILVGRTPPLRPINPTDQFLYFIPPIDCEKANDLDPQNYINNLSLVFYFRINGHKLFMPGDLMKDGMKYLIKNTSSLRSKLLEGVDILVAPHHGLKSSFSTYLFEHMKNCKTRCLNIISEKQTNEDSNRVVDTRYSSKEFCSGVNNLSENGSPVFQRKTSNGHIFIDYSQPDKPFFEIINDNADLIKRFI